MSEINELYRRKDNASSQARDYENQINSLNEKIEQLSEARRKLPIIREDVIEEISKTELQLLSCKWCGKNFDHHHSEIDENYRLSYQQYENTIEVLEDDVIREIRSLENQSCEIGDLLNNILNTINHLEGLIQNFQEREV